MDKVQLRSMNGRSITFSFSDGVSFVITGEGSTPMDPEVADKIKAAMGSKVALVEVAKPTKAPEPVKVQKAAKKAEPPKKAEKVEKPVEKPVEGPEGNDLDDEDL